MNYGLIDNLLPNVFVLSFFYIYRKFKLYLSFCLFLPLAILGKSDIQSRLESALQDVNDKYLVLEETEKNAVRTALIEERSRFCMFVTCFKPFVVSFFSFLPVHFLIHLFVQSLSPSFYCSPFHACIDQAGITETKFPQLDAFPVANIQLLPSKVILTP